MAVKVERDEVAGLLWAISVSDDRITLESPWTPIGLRSTRESLPSPPLQNRTCDVNRILAPQ